MVNNISEQCIICKDTIAIKAILDCNCFFCFDCIYRHLLYYHFCPKCISQNKYIYNISVQSIQFNKKIVLSNVLKKSEKYYKGVLKKHRITTEGLLYDLKWRYQELAIILLVESYKPNPRNTDDIAWTIHRKEKSIKQKRNNKNNIKIIELANILITKHHNKTFK